MSISWGVIIPAIVAAISAIVGSLGAYKLASKKMSGEIATSSADRLWEESRNIREDYQRRLVLADKRADELEKDIMVLDEQIRGLNLRVRDLRAILRTHNIAPPENGNGL